MNSKTLNNPWLLLVILNFLIFTNGYLYNPKRFKNIKYTSLDAGFNYPNSTFINNTALGIPYAGQMYTGYLTANQTSGAKIFYVLYSAGGQTNSNATVNNSAPLILWMQGGPGCSDSLGNFGEVGPLTMIYDNNGNPKVILQNITWNDEYNLLFIDQPVGVGYSPSNGDNITTATQAAVYMQQFLINFFKIYTSLANNPFYIFGESYAGHYIPSLASYIIENSATNGINIKGVGIGDGWTYPYYQVATYDQYSFSAGLIDENMKNELEVWELQAQDAIINGNYSGGSALFDRITGTIQNFSNIDIYNYREYNTSGDNEAIISWLNLTNTKQYLGVDPNLTFSDCNNPMYFAFYNDIGQSYADNITYLLTNKVNPIHVLLYNGQDDIIVNTPGSYDWISQLDWEGNNGFREAYRNIWTAKNGTVIGAYKNYQNFTFATVYKAGHMVPLDQPASARDLLSKYMNNYWPDTESFEIYEQRGNYLKTKDHQLITLIFVLAMIIITLFT